MLHDGDRFRAKELAANTPSILSYICILGYIIKFKINEQISEVFKLLFFHNTILYFLKAVKNRYQP
jgi:hypothetical protein